MPFELEDAIALACECHKEQKRWNGDPYITHPLRVMLKMPSNLLRMIAVLHDVIEDTPMTAAKLLELGCPQSVVDGVVALTRKEGQSHEEFIEQVATNLLSIPVKIEDITDNLNLADLKPPIKEKDLSRTGRYLTELDYLKRRRGCIQ